MYRYTTGDVHCYLWLKEKMHSYMSAQQVWHFMHRSLQVQRRRMLYLSLPIGSAGHCLRYAKVFSESNVPIHTQNPMIYRGKYVSKKIWYSPILPSLTYFIYYPGNLHILNKNNSNYTENN